MVDNMTHSKPGLAGGFPAPQEALAALERAYLQKDVEAAVAAKDFVAEARQMLKELSDGMDEDAAESAEDQEIIDSLAETLELSFRVSVQEDGFPDFAGLICNSEILQSISEELVILRETCRYPDGGVSTQDLYAAKRADGWRIAGLIDPSEDT